MLKLFTYNITSYGIELFMFYDVQTMYSTFVSINIIYVRKLWHCIISNSKSHQIP